MSSNDRQFSCADRLAVTITSGPALQHAGRVSNTQSTHKQGNYKLIFPPRSVFVCCLSYCLENLAPPEDSGLPRSNSLSIPPSSTSATHKHTQAEQQGAETEDFARSSVEGGVDTALMTVLAKLTSRDAMEIDKRTRRHRSFLTNGVVPQIAAGLLAATEVKPADPIAFLADNLIR